jgi:hypothetical protein
MYWVFTKQWNTLQDIKSNRIDYFYERFKTNYITKKISSLIITLMAFSEASFSKNTFSLLNIDLGVQATKTEEFSGFGWEGENKSPQLSWGNVAVISFYFIKLNLKLLFGFFYEVVFNYLSCSKK